ncbi:3-hydroxybutyrate dehydrogenase [Cardiosporidium cionae]|uniref:3-hydroxybutyrate dehydrogenase n=1 Tax=Cardiosporidium cionae TaxID=476202 RepID=A0ABQ7J9J9_9APIC|nr:3-hydroxybutyrate dehydrogenase [Cardiosporidium cionae]|eukprot:KAF8820667.1 3-hydroxybutyrate dehydrogenase [Cardiosporidium cionae]
MAVGMSWLGVVGLALLAILSTALLYRHFNRVTKLPGCSSNPLKPPPVLIVGCDTGIGLQLVKLLHSIGYSVIATVLHDKNLDDRFLLSLIKLPFREYFQSLCCEENVKVNSILSSFSPSSCSEDVEVASAERFLGFQLDVTDRRSIQRAQEFCQKFLSINQYQGLYAVINAAGIHHCSFFEVSAGDKDEDFNDEWSRLFNVNVGGTVSLAKAFLPLLRAFNESSLFPPSRFLVVGSILGRVGLIGHSAYCASKFALRGLVEVLQLELQLCGVYVVLIEPGALRDTSLFDSTLTEEVCATQQLYLDNHSELLAAYGQSCVRGLFEHFNFWRPIGGDTSSVCCSIARILSKRYPPDNERGIDEI